MIYNILSGIYDVMWRPTGRPTAWPTTCPTTCSTNWLRDWLIDWPTATQWKVMSIGVTAHLWLQKSNPAEFCRNPDSRVTAGAALLVICGRLARVLWSHLWLSRLDLCVAVNLAQSLSNGGHAMKSYEHWRDGTPISGWKDKPLWLPKWLRLWIRHKSWAWRHRAILRGSCGCRWWLQPLERKSAL